MGTDQALAIMVFEDGLVENRLMRRTAGVTPSALAGGVEFPQCPPARQDAGRGRARDRPASWTSARRELDAAAARLIEEGLAAWGGGDEADGP